MDRSNVLLRGVVGSTAYGLAGPDSDIDRLGIYAAPMATVLGLNGSGDLIDGSQTVDDSLVQHEPDLTLHEVGKYVRLALSANPTILELLWLPEYEIETAVGHLLVVNRSIFLSDRVKARYGGYAKAQALRLLRNHQEGKKGFSSDVRNRTAKHGRHCRRLLIQGAGILMTGEVTVKLDETQQTIVRQAGERAASNPEAFSEEMLRSIDLFYAIESTLPEKPNVAKADAILQTIRWKAWEETRPMQHYKPK